MNLKCFAATVALLFSAHAGAVSISFGCITDNDPSGDSCVIAESQLSLDVTSSLDQVLFTFNNAGPEDSFIADIYFFYEGLGSLNFDSIINEPGVGFSEGARPGHLPAYREKPFISFDADRNGTGKLGIDPGESLGILFDLDGIGFNDVLGAMSSGDLVVGLHVQGLGDHNHFSESLVNNPPAVVPVPAAVWLFGSGLLVLAGLIRRQS